MWTAKELFFFFHMWMVYSISVISLLAQSWKKARVWISYQSPAAPVGYRQKHLHSKHVRQPPALNASIMSRYPWHQIYALLSSTMWVPHQTRSALCYLTMCLAPHLSAFHHHSREDKRLAWGTAPDSQNVQHSSEMLEKICCTLG